MTLHRSHLSAFMAAMVMTLSPALFSAAPESPAKKGGISDPKQVLANMPREVMSDLRYGSRNMEAAAMKASTQARKNVEGQNASFKMTVEHVEKFERPDAPNVTRTRLRQTGAIVRDSGVNFEVFLMAVVDEGEKDKLAKIKPGSRVTVTGKISNVEISARKNVELHIDVMDAKLE